MINFVLQLVVSGWEKGNNCMDPGNDKKKKTCEKGTLRKELLHFQG